MDISNLSTIQINSLRAINNYQPTSKYDEMRLAKVKERVKTDLMRSINNQPCDCGLYGKVFEVLSRPSNSTLIDVQPQNKVDAYYTIDGIRYKAELKTNSGRIGHLFKLKKPQNFVIVYDLKMKIKAGKPRKDGTQKPEEWREVTIATTVDIFLETLKMCNATKVLTKNNISEVAIQADSLKLYKALLELANSYRFDRNKLELI